MSCYLMEDGAIGRIAGQFYQPGIYSSRGRFLNGFDKTRGVLQCDGPEEVAEILAKQNIASCAERYPNEYAGGFLDDEADGENYIKACQGFAKAAAMTYFNPLKVIELINRYEYQACETEDWMETDAYWICQAIKDDMISRLIRDMNEAEEAA